MFLYRFLHMFDVSAMGYMTHIQMIVQFLPHATKHSTLMVAKTLAIHNFRSFKSLGRGGTYTRLFTYPQRKESHRLRSGDLGGHCRNTRLVCPEHSTHLLGSVVFR